MPPKKHHEQSDPIKELAQPCVLLPILLSMELLIDVSLDLYEYDLKHPN